MFLQAAFYVSLSLLAASVAAAPSPNPHFDDSHLPGLRLPREEVQAMKKDQTYPPGYVHRNITLGEGSDAVSVPIVEANLNILLDDDDGVRARSLVARDQCISYRASQGSCLINYCWTANNGTIYSEWLGITGGKVAASDNPIRMTTSNINTLSLSTTYNTGYNSWFPNHHECSDSDTMTYTNHYLANGVTGVAYLHGLQCDTCFFKSLGCMPNTGFASNGLSAWSSSSAAPIYCGGN
jgi:hypothetical protein